MDWAIDLINKKEVHATDIDVFRGRDYFCPSCNSLVRLRRGEWRVPYFAHANGQAKPYCDRYVPGTYTDRTLMKIIEGERIQRSLGLFLRLFDDNASNSSWHLELGIPEPDRSMGILKIASAYGGERSISLHRIKSGGMRVRVRTDQKEYTLLAYDVADGEWLNRIKQPIEGLSDYAVFKFSPNGGRRLSLERPLYWGRSYILIWSMGKEPDWFPHSNILNTKPLRKQGNWSGAIINMPLFYDQLVESWVNKWLRRKVEHPTVELLLVSPLPSERLPDGSFTIDTNSNVVLSIIGEEGSKTWSELNLVTSYEERIHRHKGTGIVPYHLSIGSFELGRVDIWIDDDFESGLQLIISKFQKSLDTRSPAVVFNGTDKNDQNVSTTLHSPAAREFLEKVHNRELIFKDIYLPDRVNLSIRWSKKEAYGWNEYLFSIKPDSQDTTISQLLELFNQILDMQNVHLKISADQFGEVDMVFIGKSPEGQIIMSYNWRNSVKWLISQSFNFLVTNNNVSLYQYIGTLNLDYFCGMDRLLLNKLFQCQISHGLIPQFKIIIKECISAQNEFLVENI